MREIMRDTVRDANSLNEVRDRLAQMFAGVRQGETMTKIGYVSGIISSDGPDHIQDNLKRLEEHAERIRMREQIAIFSPVDVFDDQLYARLNAAQIPQINWQNFWREVLELGYVTDIFMTPRWKISSGSTDEHETAARLGIKIHYESE